MAFNLKFCTLKYKLQNSKITKRFNTNILNSDLLYSYYKIGKEFTESKDGQLSENKSIFEIANLGNYENYHWEWVQKDSVQQKHKEIKKNELLSPKVYIQICKFC